MRLKSHDFSLAQLFRKTNFDIVGIRLFINKQFIRVMNYYSLISISFPHFVGRRYDIRPLYIFQYYRSQAQNALVIEF